MPKEADYNSPPATNPGYCDPQPAPSCPVYPAGYPSDELQAAVYPAVHKDHIERTTLPNQGSYYLIIMVPYACWYMLHLIRARCSDVGALLHLIHFFDIASCSLATVIDYYSSVVN